MPADLWADIVTIDWTTFPLAFLVIMVAAMVQATTGFGLGVVAAPLLALKVSGGL